jgi:hypothetical protein
MSAWKAIGRDVIIILVLRALGGFVAGLAAGGTEEPPWLTYVFAHFAFGIPGFTIIGCLANFAFGIAGFTIIGCLAKENRLEHLVAVGGLVWMISAFTVRFGGITVGMWVVSIAGIAVTLLIGWGLSCIFVRAAKTPVAPDDSQESESGP